MEWASEGGFMTIGQYLVITIVYLVGDYLLSRRWHSGGADWWGLGVAAVYAIMFILIPRRIRRLKVADLDDDVAYRCVIGVFLLVAAMICLQVISE